MLCLNILAKQVFIAEARPWMARAICLGKVVRQRTLYMFTGNGFDVRTRENYQIT